MADGAARKVLLPLGRQYYDEFMQGDTLSVANAVVGVNGVFVV